MVFVNDSDSVFVVRLKAIVHEVLQDWVLVEETLDHVVTIHLVLRERSCVYHVIYMYHVMCHYMVM